MIITIILGVQNNTMRQSNVLMNARARDVEKPWIFLRFIHSHYFVTLYIWLYVFRIII